MPVGAVLLLLASAGIHAAWNLLGKRQYPSTAFMLVANTLGAMGLLPVLVLRADLVSSIPPAVWTLLFLTGLCQAVYYVALAGAYRAGDLSITYPLVRATPVLFIVAIGVLLGRGDEVSRQALAGMLLVVAGCLMLPLRRPGDVRRRHYWNLASGLALVAALGTAGYSLLDDQALRLLRQGEGIDPSTVAVTLVYALLGGLSASLWLGLAVLGRQADRRLLLQMDRISLRRAATVGAGIFFGYSLVLLAFALVKNVSYAIAFRQVSIVLGAVLGVLVLKEPRYPLKFAGVVLAFAGLVLVGTG